MKVLLNTDQLCQYQIQANVTVYDRLNEVGARIDQIPHDSD